MNDKRSLTAAQRKALRGTNNVSGSNSAQSSSRSLPTTSSASTDDDNRSADVVVGLDSFYPVSNASGVQLAGLPTSVSRGAVADAALLASKLRGQGDISPSTSTTSAATSSVGSSYAAHSKRRRRADNVVTALGDAVAASGTIAPGGPGARLHDAAALAYRRELVDSVFARIDATPVSRLSTAYVVPAWPRRWSACCSAQEAEIDGLIVSQASASSSGAPASSGAAGSTSASSSSSSAAAVTDPPLPVNLNAIVAWITSDDEECSDDAIARAALRHNPYPSWINMFHEATPAALASAAPLRQRVAIANREFMELAGLRSEAISSARMVIFPGSEGSSLPQHHPDYARPVWRALVRDVMTHVSVGRYDGVVSLPGGWTRATMSVAYTYYPSGSLRTLTCTYARVESVPIIPFPPQYAKNLAVLSSGRLVGLLTVHRTAAGDVMMNLGDRAKQAMSAAGSFDGLMATMSALVASLPPASNSAGVDNADDDDRYSVSSSSASAAFATGPAAAFTSAAAAGNGGFVSSGFSVGSLAGIEPPWMIPPHNGLQAQPRHRDIGASVSSSVLALGHAGGGGAAAPGLSSLPVSTSTLASVTTSALLPQRGFLDDFNDAASVLSFDLPVAAAASTGGSKAQIDRPPR